MKTPISQKESPVKSSNQTHRDSESDLDMGQNRISCPPRISISGFDGLKIGFGVVFENSETFFTKLDIGKQLARSLGESTTITLQGEDFMIYATGRVGGFTYHLSRGDVHIFISRREDIGQTPNIRLEIGSASCWSPGYLNVVDAVKDFLKLQGGDIRYSKVSEVHLCTDVIGQDINDLKIHNMRYWVTRAHKFSAHYSREYLEGVQLKSGDNEPLPQSSEFAIEEGITLGKGGDIMLRVYDKILELKHNARRAKQSLFSSLWDVSDYSDEPVTRVEFQIRREVFKQMKIDSLEELEEKKASIWRYCCLDWARLSESKIDRDNRHQDRAKLHPFWEFIVEVDWQKPAEQIYRDHKRCSSDWEYLAEMCAGFGMSIGVLLERKPTDLEGTIAFAQGAIEIALRKLDNRKDDKNGQSEFEKRMKKRWCNIWQMTPPMASSL